MPNRDLSESFISTGVDVAPGFRHVEALANPLAATAVTRKVDGIGLRRLLSLIATLTTSATVANRFPFLQVLDADGNVLFQSIVGTAVTASLTTTIAAYSGAVTAAALSANAVTLSAPPYWLNLGEQLQLSATGLAAGDTFTGIRATWEVIPFGTGGTDREVT